MAHRPSPPPWTRRIPALLAALALIGVGIVLPTATATPAAAAPPRDVTVSLAGTLGPAIGCGEWDVTCTAAELTARTGSVYSGTFTLPAGDYEYKVAIDHSWAESYGTGGQNVAFTLDTEQQVTFRYDDGSHAVGQLAADGSTGVSVVAAGSFQDQLGCGGTWDPGCLGSWMAPIGGTVYELRTDRLTAGSYETKAVVESNWDRSYPASNVTFEVPRDGAEVVITLDLGTGEVIVDVDGAVPGSGSTAYWLDARTLAVPASAGSGDWALQAAPNGGIQVADSGVTLPGDGQTIALTDAGTVSAELAEAQPRVRGYRALTLPDGIDAAALLSGELRVTLTGAGTVDYSTGVQTAGVIDALYTVDDDTPLGVTWSGGAPTLRVWAPTAKQVALDLAGGSVPMTRADDGTWSVTGDPSWNGMSYRYDVEVYVPGTGVVTNSVTDPYSVALTLNSTHSVLIDLDDPAFQPTIWTDNAAPVVENAVDHTIYELHVRDFSISDSTVPEAERGTYLAFTRQDSDGMTHLRELADAGLTTVHLLPTFDIASIEEDRSQQQTTGDLSGFAADSREQQDAVNAIKDQDAFNWGYDPYHFFAPEGSYATTGNQDGGARVAEFRSMVGGLHEAGLQVVLDQVFNHTAAAGQDDKSVLDKIVPGYYHRLTSAGSIETSTCCQNVATENAMAQRLMVDSVVTWAKDYRVDGFRFDLMGHHSRENMEAIRAALDELTLEKDGVDGSAIYLYGEGWDFGEVSGNALFTQATQGQLDGTGIGTFSDRLRDAVRGGSPVNGGSLFEQGFGTGLAVEPNGREAQLGDAGTVNTGSEQEYADLAHATDLVRLGLTGNLRDYSFLTSDGTVRTGDQIDYNGSPAGYATSPEEVVSYVDAHDNETLFDVLTTKLPADMDMSDRVRMNTLSLATATLSQSVTFWHAGTDLLRSKSLDRDSYNSGDHFNLLDWTGQTNNFGVGLPPEEKNGDYWDVQGPLLADANLKPGAEDIATASEAAQDLLRLRSSTPLFRLGDADQIQAKLTFPGSGPDAAPGVIVMRVDDTVGEEADPELDGLLVVFNTTGEPITETVDGLAGHDLALSAVQAEGADDVVRSTTFDQETGTVTVPARTVAVLTEAQGTAPVDPVASASITLSAGQVRAGEQVTVTGADFAAGAEVELWLHSDPVQLGTVTTAADGTFAATVTVPASTEAGAHTLRAVAGAVVAEAPLTVLAAVGDPGGSGDGTTGTGGTGGTGDGTTPTRLAVTGAGIAGLLLLAAGLITAGVLARRAQQRRA
ncbi:pullulanase-type alpha-1,6-glucosidase [Cellulomonas denverensis]|uniref:pullulanase-type alpha-1,6-glucosidase n=1 Tax=Cellulomonas denverensis TaxID=264297 RepID=UPI001A5B269F|nr:pullulanase-type alpha-1,6-glucosidase [Cellulomonas denverensis]GIG27380.1 alpha-1,6-glucosidase [Cellulomonas denverensis]